MSLGSETPSGGRAWTHRIPSDRTSEGRAVAAPVERLPAPGHQPHRRHQPDTARSLPTTEVTCFTWTSRRSGASPTPEDGAPAVVAPRRPQRSIGPWAFRRGTSTCTRPSTALPLRPHRSLPRREGKHRDRDLEPRTSVLRRARPHPYHARGCRPAFHSHGYRLSSTTESSSTAAVPPGAVASSERVSAISTLHPSPTSPSTATSSSGDRNCCSLWRSSTGTHDG